MINIHSIKDHISPDDAYLSGRLGAFAEIIERFEGRNKRIGALQEIKIIARKELMKNELR